MTTSQVDKRWIKLPCPYASILPRLEPGKLLKINHYQFLVSNHLKSDDTTRALVMYNTRTNQWQQIAEYPKQHAYGRTLNVCTYNMQQNKVYFLRRDNLMATANPSDKFVTFDIKTRKFNMNGVIAHNWCSTQDSESVNEYIHSIGGTVFFGGIRHLIFDTNDNTNLDFTPPEFREMRSILGAHCIYIRSKQILLLIGGDRGSGKPFGIWRYCLKQEKWKKMKKLSSFSLEFVVCALSANEKFVIIAGGDIVSTDDMIHGEYNHTIFVLDISDDNNYKLKECTIKLPKKYEHPQIALMGGDSDDESLIIGWIKELFKTKEFKDLSLPPMYIMKMIGLWYNQEGLHWIQDGDDYNNHYVITLKHMLRSLK